MLIGRLSCYVDSNVRKFAFRIGDFYRHNFLIRLINLFVTAGQSARFDKATAFSPSFFLLELRSRRVATAGLGHHLSVDVVGVESPFVSFFKNNFLDMQITRQWRSPQHSI